MSKSDSKVVDVIAEAIASVSGQLEMNTIEYGEIYEILDLSSQRYKVKINNNIYSMFSIIETNFSIRDKVVIMTPYGDKNHKFIMGRKRW